MKSNEGARPKWASWTGPVALLAATGVAGLWMWPTRGTDGAQWPALSLLAVAATLSVVWLFRVRAARRLSAALDSYARRELARGRRRAAPRASNSKPGLSRSAV
jgi:hypothetical protein